MIIDYGNGNAVYQAAAAPFCWTNALPPLDGVTAIRGSLLADPDILYHGLISPANIFGSIYEDSDILYHGLISAVTIGIPQRTIRIVTTGGSDPGV